MPKSPSGEPPMPSRQPEEAQGFKLLGHDRSAAWGGGSIVEVHKGYAYVGAVGGASYNGPEGFTAHDVRDPRNQRRWTRSGPRPGSIATRCAASAVLISNLNPN